MPEALKSHDFHMPSDRCVLTHRFYAMKDWNLWTSVVWVYCRIRAIATWLPKTARRTRGQSSSSTLTTVWVAPTPKSQFALIRLLTARSPRSYTLEVGIQCTITIRTTRSIKTNLRTQDPWLDARINRYILNSLSLSPTHYSYSLTSGISG